MSILRKNLAIAGTFGGIMTALAGAPAHGDADGGAPVPVSRWSGDGDTRDAMRGRNGTFVGAPSFAPGRVGRAFRFLGAEGVEIRHDAKFDVRPPGFTADLWLRGDKNQPESVATLFENSCGWTDATGWAISVSNETGFPTLAIGDGTEIREIVAGIDVLDGRYHHVAATWAGGRAKLFVDAVASEPAGLAMPAPARNARGVNIGFSWGGGIPREFFQGDVDEVEIFARALTRLDLESIVASTSGPSVDARVRTAAESPETKISKPKASDASVESGGRAHNSGDSDSVRKPADRNSSCARTGAVPNGDARNADASACSPADRPPDLACRPATRHDRDRADRCRREPARGHGNSSGIAKADYNGDGFADLAIGTPGEETPAGVRRSGAVVVIYGSADGLTATNPDVPASQFWSQNSPGVPGASESGDAFGSALAGGDFNGDGFSDLAIGVPNEDVVVPGFLGIGTTNVEFAGGVVVIYGSAAGLRSSGQGTPSAKFFTLNSAGARPDKVRPRSFLGGSLAWGDFNDDGKGDLAIGAAGFDFDRGAVWVILGSTGAGLTTNGNQFWVLGDILSFDSDPGDRWGDSLTGGDFDGDGATDLAIGAPGNDLLFSFEIGSVTVIFGSSPTGLRAKNAKFLGPPILLNADGSFNDRAQDLFGSALASGDFDGDGKSDLAVGAPGEATAYVNGAPALGLGSGAVYVHYDMDKTGSSFGFRQVHSLTQSGIRARRSVFASVSETGDEFGAALAAGDFNADGFADLAIGAPGESFGIIDDAGEVDVVYGSGSNLSFFGGGLIEFDIAPQVITKGTLGGLNLQKNRFGASLSAWNFGRNETTVTFPRTTVRTADLAIGSSSHRLPGELLPNGGSIDVLYGSRARNGLSGIGGQIWKQSSPGVPGASESGDNFGFALY